MRWAPLVLLVVASVGCGGGGGQSGEPSAYAGDYSGTWRSADLGQSGTAKVTVGPSGTVGGTITNSALNQTASLQGAVSNDGTFSGSTTYPDLPAVPATGTFTKQGASLVGHLTQTASGNTYHIDFELAGAF